MERMARRSRSVASRGQRASGFAALLEAVLGTLLLFTLTQLSRRMSRKARRGRTAVDEAEAHGRRPACILISSRNGGSQLASTVATVRSQCPVFVVSDG